VIEIQYTVQFACDSSRWRALDALDGILRYQVPGTVDCSSLSPLRTKDSRSGVVHCLQVIVAVPRRCGKRRPREPFRAMHAYVFWWRETNYEPISTNRNKITDNHNDDSYSVPGVDVSRPQFCLYHSPQCICGSRSHFSVRLLRRK
jgi:hypothetical protein